MKCSRPRPARHQLCTTALPRLADQRNLHEVSTAGPEHLNRLVSEWIEGFDPPAKFDLEDT